MSPVPGYPSLKARKVREVLRRLGWETVPGRGHGSHTVLRHSDRPQQIIWAFHNKETLGPVMVRKVLVRQAGYTEQEAKEAVRNA